MADSVLCLLISTSTGIDFGENCCFAFSSSLPFSSHFSIDFGHNQTVAKNLTPQAGLICAEVLVREAD